MIERWDMEYYRVFYYPTAVVVARCKSRRWVTYDMPSFGRSSTCPPQVLESSAVLIFMVKALIDFSQRYTEYDTPLYHFRDPV